MTTCTIPGCERRHAGRGWCQMHYMRYVRNGGPLVKKRARGVMDAPVLNAPPPRPRVALCLGRTQVRVLRELASGELVPYERLRAAIGGQSQNALQQVVSSIRIRFGWDVIETHAGEGYSAGPILRELLR